MNSDYSKLSITKTSQVLLVRRSFSVEGKPVRSMNQKSLSGFKT